MKIETPHKYKLLVKPKSTYEVVLDGEERSGFRAPDTKVCPKLYVIAQGLNIHYVGITNRPMSARINYGLKAKGANGYHGYKWKTAKGDLELFVWCFPKSSGKKFMREIETVEAEFAYLVRYKTGNWPISQNEIHFYTSTEKHRKASVKILSYCRVENA